MAADSSAFTFSAPPPRRAPQPAPEPAPEPEGPFAPRSDATTAWNPGADVTWAATPQPVTGSHGSPSDPITGSPQPAPAPGPGPAYAGVLGTPGAAVLDERGNLPGGIVGLVAAVLVTVGVFLPWIGVEGRDVSGWSASGDAKVLLVVAGLATVGAALLIAGARSLVLRLGLIGLGVVALGLGAFEIASAGGIDEFDVSLGVGLFVVLAGGLALAVAGVLTRHKRFR